MRVNRIKIAGLMILVALVAIGTSALRDDPARLAAFASWAAFVLNFAAMAMAIVSKRRSRSIAAGYVLCGTSYSLLVAYVPWVDGFVFRHSVIPTFRIMNRWMEWISPGLDYTLVPHVMVTHSLLGIAAGATGGVIGLSLALRLGGLTRRPQTTRAPHDLPR